MLYFLNFKPYALRFKSGVAVLISVILIGGIVVEIGIGGLFVIYFLTQSGFGIRLSSEALLAARSGIQDAMIKIVRNKDINYATSGSPYTINIGNRSATIAICKDSKTVSTPCDTANIGKDEIISLGIALTKRRELRAILNITTATGEVWVESLEEIALSI